MRASSSSACAWRTLACASATSATACSRALRASSYSFCATTLVPRRRRLRSKFAVLSSRSAFACATRASAVARLASARCTFTWNGAGSILATRWPFCTGELKSTSMAMIGPDTYVPTWTVVTGLTSPVAVTMAVTGPRSTVAVM